MTMGAASSVVKILAFWLEGYDNQATTTGFMSKALSPHPLCFVNGINVISSGEDGLPNAVNKYVALA